MDYKCIFCDSKIEDRSIEHIIPQSIRGRLKSPRLICRECNNKFGSQIDMVLIDRFKLIDVCLELRKDSRKKINVEVDYDGKKYILTPQGPKMKSPKALPKKENEIIPEMIFPSKEALLKHVKIMRKKYPEVDWENYIKSAKTEVVPIYAELNFISDAPLIETWRACCKILYEYLFLIKPDYIASNYKYKEFVLGQCEYTAIAINLIYIKYSPFKINRDHLYHIITIEGRKDEKVIIGYIELYSCFKVISFIDTDYKGESFITGYFQDLMSGDFGVIPDLEPLPLSKEDIVMAINDNNIDNIAPAYKESFFKTATKARLYPIKQELEEIKTFLLTNDFPNQQEKLKIVLTRLLTEFKRLGIPHTFKEFINKGDVPIDNELDNIFSLFQILLNLFQKNELDFKIISELVDLMN